jgi:hypothetical protein
MVKVPPIFPRYSVLPWIPGIRDMLALRKERTMGETKRRKHYRQTIVADGIS